MYCIKYVVLDLVIYHMSVTLTAKVEIVRLSWWALQRLKTGILKSFELRMAQHSGYPFDSHWPIGTLVLGFFKLYHLVMTNIAMENHNFSQVNHLFLWAIFHGYVK